MYYICLKGEIGMKKHTKVLPVLAILSLSLTGCNMLGHKSSVPSKYTVTWKNYDGAVLEIDEEVLEGTLPTYDGPTPVKLEDAQYSYVFSGWSREIVEVTSDIEYIATFTNELKSYNVIWKDEDGTVLETDTNVPYGSMPEFNGEEPTKDMTVQSVYSFAGWDNEVSEVVGDATYTATYSESPRKYNVTWKNEDGTVLKSEQVAYGEIPEFSEEEPTKDSTAQYKYTFNGWSPIVKEVSEDATYVATFKEEIRTYTVRWVNFDGTVLETDENLEYGATPTFDGEKPTRSDTHGLRYTWKGWTPTIVPVYRDTTYTATYKETAYFSFDLIDYQTKDGYTKADLKGSPWIDSNYHDQLSKIEKPSLKDDFYAAINYDDILNGFQGPFEVNDDVIDTALNDICFNQKETTNGDFLYYFSNKLENGDNDNIGAYLSSIPEADLLTNKVIFSSESSFLNLAYNGEGYTVSFNDGYFRSSGLQTLWFFANYEGYSQFNTYANNVINVLNPAFGLNLSSSDIQSARTIDQALSKKVYEDYYTYGNETFQTYTVSTLPWDALKTALTSLGIVDTETIKVGKMYINAMNQLFNYYAVTKHTELLNDLKLRLAVDYRFLAGFTNYKNVARSLTSTGGLFSIDDEVYQHAYDLANAIIKNVTKAAFEQSYIELSSSVETKQKVSQIIEDILDGYLEMMDEITWLSSSSKSNIKRKLNKMRYAACYSDQYKNLAKVDDTDIENASLIELYTRYNDALLQTSLNQVVEDSMIWAWDVMPSYTNNAFYYPIYNSFIILNGIVPGFLGESVEEFYGKLGMVIGHEITHAFDSSGSRYDEYGNYNDLLTSSDRQKFDSKVNKMINFYDNITLFGDTVAGGERINGEATADMGGVKVMLQLAKKIEGFDYDKFFRSVANAWCRHPYDDWTIRAMVDDAHPFAYLRVNVTLAQFDEFIETYDIGPGDGMYIPESSRVKIW